MLILHLSDIHFNNSDINKPYDQNMGLRGDTINDIKMMRGTIGKNVDVILISGDIAYRGEDTEYEYAWKWLTETLCPATGCDKERIIVIPGNHDVNRKAAAAPMHEDARNKLREVPEWKSNAAIRRYVDDEASSQMLFKPIESYNRFASNMLCSVGFYNEKTGQKPYVQRDFPLNDGSSLRVWGFNSVLVCDAEDGVNKMFVDPSAAEIIERDDGVVHLVMCHHPFNWLRNSVQFRDRIDALAKLHLFGHEHSFRVEDHKKFTRIMAGALHPDREESSWRPGYNFIDLSVTGPSDNRKLEVRLWVRQLAGPRYIPLPDENGKNPWCLEHDLPPWSAPVTTTISSAEEASETVASGEDIKMDDPPPSVRSVAIKILALREFDQKKIITELNLHQDGDQGMLDFEFALAAVRRAEERGILPELDEAIDVYTGAKAKNGSH
jgi:predicted phosphodiesterase